MRSIQMRPERNAAVSSPNLQPLMLSWGGYGHNHRDDSVDYIATTVGSQPPEQAWIGLPTPLPSRDKSLQNGNSRELSNIFRSFFLVFS